MSALAPARPVRIEYDDDAHKYTVNGEPVPSVTQILDATEHKEALTWWGMRVGMAAVVELLQLGSVTWPALQQINPLAIYDRKHPAHAETKMLLERLVVEQRLSTNHIRDDAGDRGTVIHGAVERLVAGESLQLADYPDAYHGYLSAMYGYWLEQEPEIVEQEVIVGSAKHRFAGRFDARRRRDDGGLVIVDFKTSGDLYPQYHLQLAGYEIADVECGGPECAGHELVHLRHDGNYVVKQGKGTAEQFLNRLASFRTDRELALALKPPRRRRGGAKSTPTKES